MQLRKHQQRFIDQNPDRAILNWEMRTGKTLAASLWSNHPRRNENPIVVCLKQNKKAWQREAPHTTVYTKEEFKKQNINNPSCLVLDEAHKAAAPLFTKGRSQLATCIYNFIKDNPHMHVLLLTATPVRNDPSSFHTLLCYIRVYIPWKEWRADFYKLETRPFLRFPAYFPRNDWRIKIREYVEKYTDIVSLRDCVDELPEERELVVEIDTPKYERPEDEIVTWTHEHKHEQTEKLEYIKSLEYRKLIIVCHYTDQIDEYAKELSKEKDVFVLDGRVKDQDIVKEQAKASSECYFIVQASMGMTWDGYMFGAMVFASMSHKSVDHTQMKGRLTSVDNSADVLFYYYLIGGRWDRRIYDTIKTNQDFNVHVYKHEESTRITKNT